MIAAIGIRVDIIRQFLLSQVSPPVDIFRQFLQANIFQVRRLINIIRQILWVNLQR
jgi:hypothetical protein